LLIFFAFTDHKIEEFRLIRTIDLLERVENGNNLIELIFWKHHSSGTDRNYSPFQIGEIERLVLLFFIHNDN